MIEILKNIEVHHVALVLGVLLFVFVVIFVVVFRTPIAQFFSRIKTINKGGITALPVPDEQRNPKKEIVDELVFTGKSALLTEFENNIYKDLKEKDIGVEGDAIKILVSHLANAQIATMFEITYSEIFGSQIILLKMMNERRNGMSEIEIQDYFLHIKETYHNEFKNWEVESYLNFLYFKGLIVHENQTYCITVRGIEFLGWICRHGKYENKRL